jgi:hypothetical protein
MPALGAAGAFSATAGVPGIDVPGIDVPGIDVPGIAEPGTPALGSAGMAGSAAPPAVPIAEGTPPLGALAADCAEPVAEDDPSGPPRAAFDAGAALEPSAAAPGGG